MSKDYSLQGTTKLQREKYVNDAIALSTLDAPEPSKETMALMSDYIDVEKAGKKYYHTRDVHSLKYAYDMMIAEHYAKYVTGGDGKVVAVLPPIEQMPTLRQFRYWYGKTYDDRETLVKRKGKSKFELNHRAVLGKSDYGIMGPGAKYQIDATVGDVYLVSRFNRADIIGRPVIYFIVDVFSRMIVGMYVGLEGPSWAGSMMALSNAMSDKVKYCAEYGKTITEDEWPCKSAGRVSCRPGRNGK